MQSEAPGAPRGPDCGKGGGALGREGCVLFEEAGVRAGVRTEAGARWGSWNHPGECRWWTTVAVGRWVSAYSRS